MSCTLTAVLVKEGDWVTNGTILAEVDARREKAAVDLAAAKLARVKAGNGKEEIAAAEATRTLQVLGEVVGDAPVYSGQRVTVTFTCE
jgi:multidrug efflux pump subunit AcrA (membrane-fusion protein)